MALTDDDRNEIAQLTDPEEIRQRIAGATFYLDGGPGRPRGRRDYPDDPPRIVPDTEEYIALLEARLAELEGD